MVRYVFLLLIAPETGEPPKPALKNVTMQRNNWQLRRVEDARTEVPFLKPTTVRPEA